MIVPILQMTVIIVEAATVTALLSTGGVIVPTLQMTVTTEEAATVTTLLTAVIFPTPWMIVITDKAAIVATPLATGTTIKGADIVPFLGAFHLVIEGPGEATHAVYHLRGQRGTIREVFPGVVSLVAVILLVQRESLRGVAVLVHLLDLFQGLLHLGLRLLHHEGLHYWEGLVCHSVAKGLKFL